MRRALLAAALLSVLATRTGALASDPAPITAAQGLAAARTLIVRDDAAGASHLLAALHRLAPEAAAGPAVEAPARLNLIYAMGWAGVDGTALRLTPDERRLLTMIGNLNRLTSAGDQAIELPKGLGGREVEHACDALAAVARYRPKALGEVLTRSSSHRDEATKASPGLRDCLFLEIVPAIDRSTPVGQLFAGLDLNASPEAATPLALRFLLEGRFNDSAELMTAVDPADGPRALMRATVAIRQINALNLAEDIYVQALLSNWRTQAGIVGEAFGWMYLAMATPQRMSKDATLIASAVRQSEGGPLRRSAILALIEGGHFEVAGALQAASGGASPIERLVVASAALKTGNGVAAEFRRVAESPLLDGEARANLSLVLVGRMKRERDQANARKLVIEDIDRALASPRGPSPVAFVRAVVSTRLLEGK